MEIQTCASSRHVTALATCFLLTNSKQAENTTRQCLLSSKFGTHLRINKTTMQLWVINILYVSVHLNPQNLILQSYSMLYFSVKSSVRKRNKIWYIKYHV